MSMHIWKKPSRVRPTALWSQYHNWLRIYAYVLKKPCRVRPTVLSSQYHKLAVAKCKQYTLHVVIYSSPQINNSIAPTTNMLCFPQKSYNNSNKIHLVMFKLQTLQENEVLMLGQYHRSQYNVVDLSQHSNHNLCLQYYPCALVAEIISNIFRDNSD